MNKRLKNQRWRIIFAKYFLKKQQEFESKKFLDNYCEHEADYTKKLIEELRKPFFKEKANVFNRRNSIYTGSNIPKEKNQKHSVRNTSVMKEKFILIYF